MKMGRTGAMCAAAALASCSGLALASTGVDEWGLGWNSGGPWRPALFVVSPQELTTALMKTLDDVNQEATEGLMPPGELFAACFDPEKPPTKEVYDALEQRMREIIDEMGLKYQATSRWSGTAPAPVGGSYGVTGDPITITWSFVPDGLSISSGTGEPVAPSNLFATLDASYASQGGRATWINRFVQVFNRWSQLSGVTYLRIQGGASNADADDGATWTATGAATRGQIRISMKPIDGGGGILAYNFFPGSGTGGNMVLDSGDNYASSTNLNRFARNIYAHENGHGMGVSHVCPITQGKLMEPFLATNFDGPRADDVRAYQRLYGDPSEPDNTQPVARDRGNLTVGTTTQFGIPPAPISGTSDNNGTTLSIDADGEQDWHRFGATQPLLVNFTLIPVGTSYVDVPQSQACNETSPLVDYLRQANLALQIVNSAGTVVFEASAAGLGTNEVISNVFLSPNTSPTPNLWARVYETDAPTRVQSYRISAQALSNTFSISASDGTGTDVDLTWTAIPGATSYQIFRNTTNNEAGASSIGTSATNAFTDATAVGGQTYFYFVRVVQGGGAARSFGLSDSGFASLPNCPGDISGPTPGVPDGEIDLNDFFYFFDCFDAELPCADLDGTPGVDLGDFFFFFNAFDAPCP